MNGAERRNRNAGVLELVTEMREAVQGWGGQLDTQGPEVRESYSVGGEEFARIWVYNERIFLVLRVPFGDLRNPHSLGEARYGNELKGWREGHFGSYFTDIRDWGPLRPLLKQALEAWAGGGSAPIKKGMVGK